MTGLVDLLTAWPLAASIVAAVTARGVWLGRRRATLNEALHEVRRPLQALALAGGPGQALPGPIDSSLRLAVDALERLDRAINGDGSDATRGDVPVLPLLESAIGRWRGRATLVGVSLALRWSAGEAVVDGDRLGLAQALDNLILNAIEHGGPEVVAEAQRRDDRLRIAIVDSGRGSRPPARRGAPLETIARLSGRSRRGHGLAVVRRTAAEHGGRFALHRSENGSVAVLELPLAA